MPRGWLVRWSALLLCLGVLGLTACTDPEDARYVREETGRLSVDRPAAWATPIEVQEPWTAGFQQGPDSVEQIQLSGLLGEYATASEAASTLIGQAQLAPGLDGFEVVEIREVSIEGATTGQLTRFTVDSPDGGQVSGTWVVAARYPYPQAVAVSILTPVHDPELERRVLESMELHPEQ
ncbi:hypothetical protein [Desertihabitans brevis]|uniref:hypothetical protein n=1 Tax=Desertihabitans brevis TaxID=2268447 RepID=UPI0011BE5D2D|nr:hypothetical protein [Desertihabitans brevis]